MRKIVQLGILVLALALFTALGIGQHLSAGLVGPRPTPVANPGTPISIPPPVSPGTPVP